MAKVSPQTKFGIVSSFKLGYRNREDKTNLKPGILIEGSQNVLTDVTGRVGITKGYALDGAASVVMAPILAAYDYEMHTGQIRHLRAGFLTNTGNDGKLQYRYVATDGTVSWRDLMTSLTSVSFNFADYWDNANFQSNLLFVNGSANIYKWTGGITTYASSTINTITKEGTETWGEIGFSPTGSVVIGGVTYAYTGGTGTTTLTGVTPDPTGGGHTAGDIVHQAVVTTANSAMTSLPTINNALISNLKNQIYIGSLTNNQVYVSNVNDYLDYSFTSPVRVVGEGAILTLDATPRAFVTQEESMYISAGQDQWYETTFTLSADLTAESLTINRLKTTSQQAAQSQALTSKIKNNVVFVSNEPILNSLGRVSDVVVTPQTIDVSFPIVNDFNTYDFTDGQVFYHQKFIYVAVPQESLIRIYNMTDSVDNSELIVSSTQFYWEAPVTFPVSRFSVIDGELYGHSYLTSESYKLFTGYNFNGSPIDARAVFSYMNSEVRESTKSQNEFYVEGYISSNSILNTNFNYELDGYAGQATYPLEGTDMQVVFIPSSSSSLGKSSLGKNPLGGELVGSTGQPAKFRVIWTFPRIPYFEFSPSFTSVGTDFNWSILAFGAEAALTTEGQNDIKK